MRFAARCLRVLLASSAVPAVVLAGFPSTDVFLPAVGRIAGSGGAQFFTTIWATNLTGAPETFTFQFLKQGQANDASPSSFQDTLAPGQTKVYENVVETKLGLSNAIGAARVTSTGEIFVSERIFNQAPGADLGNTEGLFFAGVPRAFSIAAGQSASIQGLNQGGSENFRYNFALVETGGGSPVVNVQVFDGGGVLLGQRAFPLLPFEQLQPNVSDVVPGFSSINARITATVTGGTGSVLLAGAQLANVSQDSSGFEMSFRDDLLGGGGPAGVTSLNGLTGALALTPGDGISITPSGSSIAIAFTGGGSSGLSAVSHNGTLTGNGTGGAPLGVAVPLVLVSSGVGAIQTTSGGTSAKIQSIAATLSSAGFNHSAAIAGTLDASIGDDDIFGVLGTAQSGATGVQGESQLGVGVRGVSSGFAGVAGLSEASGADTSGTLGRDGTGFANLSGFASAGVRGESLGHFGVIGLTGTTSSFAGVLGVDGNGLSGLNPLSAGVRGESQQNQGVLGLASSGNGVHGRSDSGLGVTGFSQSGTAVHGETVSGKAGVEGDNSASALDKAGVLGIDGTGSAGISKVLSAGVRGESNSNVGVMGLSHNFAVVGKLVGPVSVQGELGSHRNSADWALFTFGNANIGGTLTISGSKSFVEPHPTDPTKEIRFVCLEGPESGTYFRGHGRISGGFAKIAVPESFRMVTDSENVTVQLTPNGGLAVLACIRKGLDEIVVQGSSDVEFDYMVNGVRKAYKDFEVVRENQLFIPDGPDDRRFPLYAPEIQRRLVATGIYNPDGTVNLATAKRLGWDRNWVKPETE